MKYAVVAALAFLLWGLGIYLVTPLMAEGLGPWLWVVVAMVLSWVYGRLVGELIFGWYMRDRFKALEDEWKAVVE